MKRVWSDEAKLGRWLEVELAALDGWADVGVVPADAAARIREAATPPELDRDRERLVRALEGIRVGKLGGAVGTYAGGDPEVERIACERLGLVPEPVATQVVPRDRHAELLSVLALCGASLERFATEIRH